MPDAAPARFGTVYLVGAGPGDPGLLTLRGAEVLARADVVYYDYLANPELLRHVRPGAECVSLGRHGGERLWPQEEIHAALIGQAHAGRTVVRLKGGDPAIFARAAEETAALEAAGVGYEIVPGITAALAAGSYAAVTLTHRETASAVAFVTGQERADKEAAPLDYAALARFPGTLVFYMGVTTAPAWSAALLRAGKPADTPACLVRHCSLPDQQTIACTLAEVPQHLGPGSALRPPVIAVVGEGARRAGERSWFERRPLFGQRVLVTRPKDQADALAARLAELGADVLVQPAIEIGPPPDYGPLDEALKHLSRFDWLVFSSTNGVAAALDRLPALGLDLRALGGVKLAAVGPSTAHELARRGLRADLVPSEYRAEALADALAAAAPRASFLLLRASRGREVLAERLAEAGGRVEQVVAYTSRDVAAPDPRVEAAVAAEAPLWITVTSSAIARSLAAMFGALLQRHRLVSISPITSGVLRELGYEPAAEARQYDMPGLLAALQRAAGFTPGHGAADE